MAAAETHSYARAELMLAVLSEIEISSRQVNRLTDEAGRALREEQQQRVTLHEQKKLAVEVNNIPELAVVETDGGRIRTREIAHGSGTHHPAWKESKTALFMRMASETHAADPASEPPESLQNRGYVGQLVQQMAGAVAPAEKDDEVSADAIEHTSTTAKYESPKRLMRTCLAKMKTSAGVCTLIGCVVAGRVAWAMSLLSWPIGLLLVRRFRRTSTKMTRVKSSAVRWDT
jgi:hypothetical protein